MYYKNGALWNIKIIKEFNCIQICNKKWVQVNDLSSDQYSVNKKIRFKTSMLRSDLWDYSDAYIVVKGTITVEGNNVAKTRNKKLIFENNALFRSCMSKINNTFIDNAEDLDVFMPVHNLIEYSDNYSIKSGSLSNYYGDEVNDDANENNPARIKTNNNKTIKGKSFEYKTKLIGSSPNNNSILDAEVVVALECSSCYFIY